MDTQQLTATPLTTTLRATNLQTGLQATGLQTVNPLNLSTQSLVGASATNTFTVTNLNDSGAGSLRQAIVNANADSAKTPGVADVINFNLGAGAHIITLTSANLDITAKNLTINGTGASNLLISGGNKLQDFKIESGANVTLSGLSIIQGTSSMGGGIFNNGTLTLNNDTLSNNTATVINGDVANTGFGAGVENFGALIVNNSNFNNNIAKGVGGGAIDSIGTITINGSTFTNNNGGSGGALFNQGTGTIKGSTFSNNIGINGGGIYNLGPLTVDGSTFSNNNGSGGFGGGIVDAGNSTLTVTNSSFFNNTVGGGFGGGILNNNTSKLSVSNSTFIGNTASQGAAIYNDNAHGATLDASGLIFSGNTSSQSAGTATNNNDIFGSFNAITVDSLLDTNAINFSAGNVSLREAILATAPGGTINFASSLAGGTITLTQGELAIDHNLTIQGLGANKLTISGNHQSRDVTIASGVTVDLTDLTLADGNTTTSDGGGILNNGTLTLTNDIIRGNHALSGGGIFSAGKLTLSNTQFNGNAADNLGGAIVNLGQLSGTQDSFTKNTANLSAGAIWSNGSLTLNNSQFTTNTATQDAGAIWNSGTASLSNDTFNTNTAAAHGGAIDNAGSLTLNNSNLSGNNGGIFGGAIYSQGTGSLNLSANTFSNNTAQNGGAIYTANNLTIVNSTFTGNKATTGSGGAITISFGTDTITGSTFTNNTAQSGGAINSAGNLTLTNDKLTGNKAVNANGVGGGIWNNGVLTLNGDTITGNSAVFEGGGVFNAIGSIVNVHNTIIKTNTALAGPDVFGSFITQGGNTIGILDDTATGFINGQNGDTVQKTQVAPKMESYTFTYNYTAKPIINGGATPQDYLGNGFAAVGTYKAGQTISIKNGAGQIVGTYTINSVNNNAILNPTQLNHINITEYDYDLGGAPKVTKVIVGTGLDPASGGANGLGSEHGVLIGRGAFGGNVSFSNQNEAIVPIHF